MKETRKIYSVNMGKKKKCVRTDDNKRITTEVDITHHVVANCFTVCHMQTNHLGD